MYLAPSRVTKASVVVPRALETTLPLPLKVMVLVALVPGTFTIVIFSLYGPVPATTSKTTEAEMPQLASAEIADAKLVKLVEEAGEFLSMVRLPLSALQEIIVVARVSL